MVVMAMMAVMSLVVVTKATAAVMLVVDGCDRGDGDVKTCKWTQFTVFAVPRLLQYEGGSRVGVVKKYVCAIMNYAMVSSVVLRTMVRGDVIAMSDLKVVMSQGQQW